jgi:hypothetical protein
MSMTEAEYLTEHGPNLLRELLKHRDTLVAQLAHPEAVGNLEEQSADRIIARLAAVQSCIVAAREVVEGVK